MQGVWEFELAHCPPWATFLHSSTWHLPRAASVRAGQSAGGPGAAVETGSGGASAGGRLPGPGSQGGNPSPATPPDRFSQIPKVTY